MRIILSLIMATAFSSSLYAASISFSVGKTEVKINKKWQRATTGQLNKAVTAVRTGAKSLAIISLNKTTVIKLRANTEISFNTMDKKKISLFLKRGGVFSRIQKNAGNNYSIRTSTATAAVRGTEFFMAFGEKGSRGQEIWLCVNEGNVAVTGKSKVHPIMVAAGLGVYIDTDGDITPPEKFNWTKRLNWNTDPEKGSVQDNTNIIDVYRNFFNEDYN